MVMRAVNESAVDTPASTPVSDFLQSYGVPYADILGSGITFVVVLFVVYTVGRLTIVTVISRGMKARGLDEHARRPLAKLTKGVVVFVAIAVAFGAAGFGSFLQSLATIAAAATLAIGFAMQDVIKNFVAGIFIFTDKPFRIGHWIEFDGYSGEVEDISLRVTRVRTFDNELLTVPNSQLTDGVIKNPVAKDTLRQKFTFGIGYGDDIDQATEVIIEEAEAHDEILEEPGPSVRLVELGDSSVGLQARIWIANPSRSDFVRTRAEYVQAVKERFDEAGISIPYPNRTLGGGLALEGVEIAGGSGDGVASKSGDEESGEAADGVASKSGDEEAGEAADGVASKSGDEEAGEAADGESGAGTDET